jgi:opacity protein-like surface antigen
MSKASIAAVLLAAVASSGVHADQTRTEGTNLELTPYFWAAGQDGKLELNNETVHFNRDFSDLLDNTDAAFMGLAVISFDRFVLYADYDYMSLSSDEHSKSGILAPAGTKLKTETDSGIGTYGGGYRFDTFGTNTMDVLIGVQLTDIQTKIKASGNSFENKDNITDTVIMLRPSLQLSERWRFNPTMAYGISGDSDTTYSLMPQLQWQFSESFALRFGYKRLHYKFKDNGNAIDTTFSGPFLGVGWTFPERK